MASISAEKANKKRIACRIGAMAAAISLAFATAAVSTASAQVSASASSASSSDAAAGEAKVAIAGNHPAEAADLTSGPEIASTKSLRMEVVLALHNRAALDALIAAQQDRSSPQYHQWLTPAEFSARFGPTQSDVAAVSSWLSGQGFSVESQSLPMRKIVFSGAAANAESTFGVKIHTDQTQTRFANLSDPVVPKSIASSVASIRGLSNLGHALPALELSPNFSSVPDVKIGKVTHFGPNDLYTFYDEAPPTSSSNNGTGADCIAVAEDSDFDDGSVIAFDNQFGVAAIDSVRIYADGSDPGESGNDAIEALLDVEYAHAAAPGVPIYAYIGNNLASPDGSGVLDAAAKAVSDDTCGAISLSFSFCGQPSSFYTGSIDPIAAQAASQGQAVFASSGDFGAAGYVEQNDTCVPGSTRNVSELSADPNITAVGGTQFTPHYKKGNDFSHTRESIWKDKSGSGGGGESGIFPKPTYQSGLISTDTNRDVPDVSLAASPLHPGFFLGYNDAIYCCIGGTSLSAPYWAGIAQLAAQKSGATRVGPLNPTLYSIASGGGIRDVTKGNNTFHKVTGFKATAGYDRSSGLGSPDIDNLTSAIAAH
ncbi:MAG: S53 family peptidase [Candidatus Binataceae bacterium]